MINCMWCCETAFLTETDFEDKSVLIETDIEEKIRFDLVGHSAHLGTATCPSSKLVPKFEKGDNLMKHVYLAYGGNW